MTLVTPRIVNNVSCVKRINDECYFSWQAQYLVKFKREMLYFSIQTARGGREKKPRLRGGLRTDGFMLGSCSDHSRGSAAHWK